MVDYFCNHRRRHRISSIVQIRRTNDDPQNQWIRAYRNCRGRRTRSIHRDIGLFEPKDENICTSDFRRLYASAHTGWARYFFDAVGRINHRHTRLRSLEMGTR